MPPLHHIWVTASDDPTRFIFVLHGILGSGQNFRSLAQQMADARPDTALALVDLRFHGRSGPRPAPQTLEAAARDLVELEATLACPCAGVMGHSFGGKVATTYASQHAGSLRRLWVLDSPPGAREGGDGSESTLHILDLLEAAPRNWKTRRDFVAHLEAQGLSRAIGQWLGMNLARSETGFELGIDIPAIRELLDDYFRSDLWPALEETSIPVSLVLGDRSEVFSDAQRARAQQLAERCAHVTLRTVADSGHWLHADNPDGTLQAVLADWP